MVVVSSLQTNLDFSSSSSLFFKPISPSLLYFRRFYRFPCSRNNKAAYNSSNGSAVLVVKAYMDETTNPVSSFVNKVVGSLPVVGLIARIVNEEGGVGGDIIDFAEFRRRVGNKCSITDSRAFYEFRDRRGKVILYLQSKCLAYLSIISFWCRCGATISSSRFWNYNFKY